MSSHLWWYVARASGIVAWGLVSASVAMGLWLSLRLTRRRPKPAWVLDLHRFLGGLSVTFIGIHLAGLVADSYVSFGPGELLVPLASAWSPVAVAWGIVAMYMLLAVEATSLMMRRIPRRLWHGIHLTSYAVFALSTIHLVAAGTDSGNPVLQWAVLVVTGLIGFLTAARLLGARRGGANAPARPQSVSGTRTARAGGPEVVARLR